MCAGYEVLSDFLMRFACMGDEEKGLLITYGAVYRYASKSSSYRVLAPLYPCLVKNLCRLCIM